MTPQSGRSTGLHEQALRPRTPSPARREASLTGSALQQSAAASSVSASDAPLPLPAGSGDELPRLGLLIRRHRTRTGLTQRELADLSTISVRAIRDLEQNRVRRPRTETVRLIADALRLGPRSRETLQQAAAQHRFAGLGESDGADATPPAPLRPLTGRADETAVIAAELATGSQRLVHIVGLPGAGKTSLALEVARRLHREERLPVLWFARSPRAGSGTPDSPRSGTGRLLHDCVTGLFTDGTAAAPGTGDSDAPTLAEHLGDQVVLLVIDGASGRSVHPERLARLLRDCPGLRVLVTSDDPWHVPGERVFLLTPLATDHEDGDTVGGATQLLLDDIRRVSPGAVTTAQDLAVVADISRRLDGLPTALLAASSWLVLYDAASLRRRLAEDPLPFLDHLAEPETAGRCLAALRDRVAALPQGHRAMLAALCDAEAAEFSLDDVEALTGSPLGHCGRTMRDLLVSGVVRTVAGPAGTRFQVLRLIRAACRDTPAD
ncbi:XRE family transcriptional regulator [Streptomyces sp. ventii]|uniref:XRE family transcriptional regulator n=2 Tax=Streptomyces spiramenti TaxID=2720606 RepID=A0ABX1AQ69_9ACTN|nr:helix-turn-helix domain-containing protein [Streptomyces spiramenti]NJP66447.1 XRE family transcriptional regulator [Streptomyces spiramenti]